jgi:hypothetical protein
MAMKEWVFFFDNIAASSYSEYEKASTQGWQLRMQARHKTSAAMAFYVL